MSSSGCRSSAAASPARRPPRWPVRTFGRSPTSSGSRSCAGWSSAASRSTSSCASTPPAGWPTTRDGSAGALERPRGYHLGRLRSRRADLSVREWPRPATSCAASWRTSGRGRVGRRPLGRCRGGGGLRRPSRLLLRPRRARGGGDVRADRAAQERSGMTGPSAPERARLPRSIRRLARLRRAPRGGSPRSACRCSGRRGWAGDRHGLLALGTFAFQRDDNDAATTFLAGGGRGVRGARRSARQGRVAGLARGGPGSCSATWPARAAYEAGYATADRRGTRSIAPTS